MAWTLCTKEDVTSLYPIDEANLDDTWSELVEGLIRTYKGTPYLGIATTVTDEYHNGVEGTDIITVKKPPISSVTSVTVDGALLTSADYIVYTHSIQLISRTIKEGRANVKITYVSGTPGTSDDPNVRFAAIAMIIAIINYRGRLGSDSSVKFASAVPEEGQVSPNINVGLVTHLRAIMKGFLRREKVRVRL